LREKERRLDLIGFSADLVAYYSVLGRLVQRTW